jgi:hypothetical protein
MKRILELLLVLSLTLSAAAQQAAETQPTYTLRGRFVDADNNTYRSLPFDVPAGTHRLTIVFSHTQAEQRTVIDLGLYDPNRLRGWSGSDKNWFTISDVDATASYLPGPIQPGTWKLQLGVPNIRKGVTAEYTAKIYLSRSIQLPNISETVPQPLREGPGWYQGDLHDHTGHSDGKCNSMSRSDQKVFCPEFRVLEKAASLGLDFVAVTDHNTVSHHNELEQWQAYFDRLLLIRGREITTFVGHANVFGTSADIDFRVAPGFTATDMAKSVRAAGGVLSLNHPVRPSGEDCMGCGWRAPIDYSLVDGVEAVNGIDPDTPYSGIPFWQAQLNEGHRVSAIGGSDDHSLPEVAGLRGALGVPTTVVYTSELSERAVLDGIRAGHVFLKVKGPQGPSVYLGATAGNQSAIIGDNLRVPAGEQISFSVQALGAPNAHVEVILDGNPAALLPETRVKSPDETLRFTVKSDGGRHWYRVNLRAPDGGLLALTNPIYENFAERAP